MTFSDRVQITLASGKGGKGSVHFQRTRTAPRGGPDGGDGGKGGDLVLSPNSSLRDLSHFVNNSCYRAENGKPGDGGRKKGAEGQDCTLYVPEGTCLYDLEGRFLKEIKAKDYIFLQGGKGGKGNNFFKNSRVQAPQVSQPGEAGEQKKVVLELRWQSDACFIGLRNSGKTSIALCLSNRKEKIYPSSFPRQFSVQNSQKSIELVDLPGLSSSTRKFLKQAEKTKIIIFVISLMDENPLKTYQKLREELLLHDQKHQTNLSKKSQFLVLSGKEKSYVFDKILSFSKISRKYLFVFDVKDESKVQNLLKEIKRLLKK